ncbi:MAG: alanine racemase [Comamonadaceae bacterium]|nr:alanine racemase [Comamonadaceae bacterium]
MELCSRLDLWHVVHCAEQIDWLAAHKTHQPAPRVPEDEQRHEPAGLHADAPSARAWARLNALPQVDEISLMTHFSDADGARGIAHQVAAFEAATRDLPGERSLSNSAARSLRHGAAWRSDWVRAGILCYGSAPDFPEHDIAHWGLQPTMTLRSRADRHAGAAARRHASATAAASPPARRCASASSPAATPTATRATAAHRHAGAGGRRAHAAPSGRVSMDMLAVDLTRAARRRHRQRGHAVGPRPGGAVLAIDEIARAAGTIGYELMCAVAPRAGARRRGGLMRAAAASPARASTGGGRRR